jgi:heme oxygenase
MMAGVKATPSGLHARLKSETRALHAQAERAGVMGELLGRRIGRAAYCAMLRNLHAIYEALETALDALPAKAPVRTLWRDALRRTPRLAADLEALHGRDWRRELPLASATRGYVERLRALGGASALAAHAYVRYLGDLNGGRVLAPLVREQLDLAGGTGAAFYEFSGDPAALREDFGAALAALPVAPADEDAIVAEARWAFEAHRRLFEELAAA